jgi:integrase
MAKQILAWSDSAGQFYREIGKRPNGKPPRIYLGADAKQAAANVARLEGLWRGVEAQWHDFNEEGLADTPAPCWDDLTLSLARAIGRGQWTTKVEPPEDSPQELAVWMASLRTYFPMIQVEIEDTKTLAEGNQVFIQSTKQQADEEVKNHQKVMRDLKNSMMPFGGKIITKETLHDALDAYKEWIEKTFVNIEGKTTQTGKKQGDRAERIKRYASDMSLSDFGNPEIEGIIEFWRTRPKKADGKPYAFTLCKHTIRLFKHFLRWLHKEPSLPWKKPVDLDLDRIKIVPDTEIKYKVETYSKEELAILWQHASHFERQLLLLALNCGFSISEIGRLDWSEVDGDFIKGLRPKTKVYGEFRLWEITRKAMGNPKKKGPVFVTRSGLSLVAPTKGNNTSAKIPAAWYRLLNRVEKHQPGFKRLGFHHLRKTAGNMVRKFSDGETMGVFLRHGKPVKSDALPGIYSNPVFQRVFDAQERMWEFLKDIFTPLEEVDLPRKISPAAIRQIRSLKKQGIKTKKLSEMFGISPSQVRTYCRSK